MQYATLKGKDGKDISVPTSQFRLNENQAAYIVGLDFDDLGGLVEIQDRPGFESFHMGKLSEINFIMQCQLTNSLVLDGFPLDECPDPEVTIVTALNN